MATSPSKSPPAKRAKASKSARAQSSQDASTSQPAKDKPPAKAKGKKKKVAEGEDEGGDIEFTWGEAGEADDLEPLPFTSEPGLKKSPTTRGLESVADFFGMVMDDDMLEEVCLFTNKHAS